jgi:hypothetical protein
MSNKPNIKEEIKSEMVSPISIIMSEGITALKNNSASLVLSCALIIYIIYDKKGDEIRDKKINDCEKTYVSYILENNDELTANLQLAMKEARDNTKVLKMYLKKTHKIEFENDDETTISLSR